MIFTIYDGTGTPGYVADLGVVESRGRPCCSLLAAGCRDGLEHGRYVSDI